MNVKKKWNIIHDCDLDDGTPTQWALKVAEDPDKFYWIDSLEDGTFDVIDSDCHTLLANCKSLTSAKRWVTINLLL